MGSQRFDGVVRAVVGGASGRGVLKRLAGGGAGLAGLVLGGRSAGAAKGDCGPCKSRPAGGGRCTYDCDRETEVCDANLAGGTCVPRQPVDA